MKICDMPKIERDEKGRFMRGVSQCPEFYKKAIQTRKNTILKRGYYFSEETKKKIGDKNKISLKGRKLSKESIKKRYETRIKNGWYKNREETLKKISKQNSILWLGGEREEAYNSEFTKHLKNKIKKRDNYTCQICGLTKRNMHSHHVDYNKKNNSEDNLIYLCNSCHSKTNYNRRYWVDLLYTFLSHKNSKYNEVWKYINTPLEVTYD